MTTATIEQRLSEPEGKQLEFKRDLSSPKPLMKTLVAFANTAGGQLIIGVDDDGTVLGVDDPLDIEERLTSMIADAIHPRLLPNIELVSVGEHTLVCIEVFLSSARPHFFKALGEENGVLVRLGSSNRQAGLALIQEMQRQASGTTFDVQPMPELSRDDLDQNAELERTLRRRFELVAPAGDARVSVAELPGTHLSPVFFKFDVAGLSPAFAKLGGVKVGDEAQVERLARDGVAFLTGKSA